MGRGKNVEQFQSNASQSKIAKTLKISSTVHAYHQKIPRIWTTDEPETQYWMPIYEPLNGTTLQKAWFCGGYHCMLSGILLKVIVCKYRSSCHQTCQLKLYHARTINDMMMIQKYQHKMVCCTAEICSVVKWITIWHSFWLLGEAPSVFFQCTVQKPASLMVWECINGYGMRRLHICKADINDERYIQGLEQDVLPFRQHFLQGRPYIFMIHNTKPVNLHL